MPWDRERPSLPTAALFSPPARALPVLPRTHELPSVLTLLRYSYVLERKTNKWEKTLIPGSKISTLVTQFL